MAMMTASFHQNANPSKYFLPTQTAGPSPPEEYLYGRSANTSTSALAPAPAPAAAPAMPNTPPSNTSPTNQYNFHVRQLRQPRQPMYIPAALRPTELPPTARDIPDRPRPLDTPPTSQGNSYDSARSNSQSLGNTVVTFDFQYDAAQQLGTSGFSGSFDESTDEVTGPPTTAHWKPDASADGCFVCNVQFTWYFRRHHCRRCGNVVCENHMTKIVPLDHNARFHLKGTPSKACPPCHAEWKYIKRIRHSRASSLADSFSTSPDLIIPSMPIPKPQLSYDDQRVGSMARSEGGMTWSTF